MKKTAALLLAAMFALSLTACGGNGSSKTDAGSAALSQPAEQPKATAAAPATEAAPDYLGTWTFDSAASSKGFADSGSLVLNADNTFALTSSSSASAKTEVEAGTYTVSGSSITLTLTHYTETRDGKVTSDEDILNGDSLEGTINGNQMVLGTGSNTVVFIK